MTLTGPDLILAVAERAREREQPFSVEFSTMVQQAILGRDMLLTEATATRPLDEHEASPVSILLGAYQAAINQGDAESIMEVLQFGLALLAKWPSYLAVMEEHPSLELRID